MRKLLSSLFVCFLLAFGLSTAHAQFEKGQIDVNLGVGLLPTYLGSGFTSTLPPIGLSVDYGVTDNISIGGFASYSAAKYDFSGFGSNSEWKYTYVIVGARGAYHFEMSNEKFDPYAGALLGYNVASVTTEDDNIDTSSVSAGGFAYSVFLGARYRFTEKIGVFAELGYGISVLQLGLNVKF